MGTRIPHSILIHDLFGIEIQNSMQLSVSEIEFQFQCQVNHGPESNIEFSFS